MAPRASVAFVPDEAQASTVRVGVGVFTEPVGTDVSFDTIRFDSDHQRQLVVPNPGFFPVVPEEISGELTPLSATYAKSPELRAPRFLTSSVSYERTLPAGLAASVGYVWSQGRNLWRLRNINAPLDAQGDVAPQPGLGPLLQFESTGISTQHELELSLTSNIGESVSSYFTYTLGSTEVTVQVTAALAAVKGPPVAADDIESRRSDRRAH